MPVTALTKVTAVAYGKGIKDAGFQAVDQSNDNNFVNTGKTLLLVTRTGGAVTATIKAIAASKFTLDGAATTKALDAPIADGKIGVFGPFPVAIYGTSVQVGYDTGTSVTAAVVELADNPPL